MWSKLSTCDWTTKTTCKWLHANRASELKWFINLIKFEWVKKKVFFSFWFSCFWNDGQIAELVFGYTCFNTACCHRFQALQIQSCDLVNTECRRQTPRLVFRLWAWRHPTWCSSNVHLRQPLVVPNLILGNEIVGWTSYLLSSPDRAASKELFPQPTFPTTTTREPCRGNENKW